MSISVSAALIALSDISSRRCGLIRRKSRRTVTARRNSACHQAAQLKSKAPTGVWKSSFTRVKADAAPCQYLPIFNPLQLIGRRVRIGDAPQIERRSVVCTRCAIIVVVPEWVDYARRGIRRVGCEHIWL